MVSTADSLQVRKALFVLAGKTSLQSQGRSLFYLDRTGLKRLYRTRAKMVHPDVKGGDAGEFALVLEAYEYLDSMLKANPGGLEGYWDTGSRKSAPPRESGRGPVTGTPPGAGERKQEHPGQKPGKGTAPSRFAGEVPKRSLRFGQYLYYRGLVSLDDLIRSLVWQHSRRPSFGQIAQSYRFFTPESVQMVLRLRRAGEKMGEAAVRLGLLDSYQRLVVLGSQRWYKAEVGQFFLEEGLLTPTELASALEEHRCHNLRHGRSVRP